MDKGRIKILFLIDELIAGGTEKQLLFLAENLDRKVFDPTIGILNKNNYQNTIKIKTRIIDFRWSGLPLVKNYLLVLKLKHFIERERVEIVQTHLIESSIYGPLAARASTPRPYLICTRRNLYHWKRDELINFYLNQYMARWADRILVNSRSVFKECQGRENIPREKIALIPNTIDVGRFTGIPTEEAKETIGLGGEFPVIGVVANFRPVKGLLSFLEAAATVHREIPTASFVLVGKGPQENELKAYSQKLEIQNQVKFLIDCPDIPKAIAAFDIAVQPSLSESLSNVLLEYMASSKPIVATRVGDAEIVIENGKDGLLVKPNSQEELSVAILSLCRNQRRANEMGKLAKEKVELNWSHYKTLETYQQFYQEIIQKKRCNA